MNLSADYTLTPAGLERALTQLVGANQPVMVWGPPGIGKSDVAKKVAADRGATYIDVRALLLDPVDLRGIPYRDDDGRTRWAVPDFLPPSDSEDEFLINLEELPNAPPMVQAALYQLVLDRKVGEYTLPKNARIVACGNRAQDRAGTFRMSAPLASRFVNLEARADIDSWIDWALQNDIAVEVIFFLKFRPELLMAFDPKSSEMAFPCPRTWQFVSTLVQAGNTGSTTEDLAILRGAIGEGAAVEFAAFLQVFKKLPAPDSIFADPTGCDMPSDASVMIALCGALARSVDDAKMDALVAFAKRDDMRPEIGEFLISSSIAMQPALQYTKAYVQWSQHATRD